MTAKAELYDVIRKPIITEKATMASENGAVVFEVAIDSQQAADQKSHRRAFWREGESREHGCHQR